MSGSSTETAIALLENDQQYQLAKKLFMEHATLADVSRGAGVSVPTVKKWRDAAGWLTEREDEERGVLETAFGARKVTLAKLLRATADQLLRGVEHIQKRTEPPNLEESLKLSMILSNLDKHARLDSDKATENIKVSVAHVNATADQIRQAFLEDPFFDMNPPASPVTDAEFTEEPK